MYFSSNYLHIYSCKKIFFSPTICICFCFQFIEFKPEDQDVTLLPVKLPLQIKTEIDVKSDLDPKFTRVKVKSEPMDTDEVVKPKTAVEDEKPKVFNNKQATRPVTCADLFANPAKSGKARSIYSIAIIFYMSRLVGKPTMWFPNRSDTNRPVQAQKRARSLKFWI